jgi:methylthioribose-1-phosphate isomerase
MKLLTTACLMVSFILCLVMVWLLGQVKMPHQTRLAQFRHVQEMQITTMLIILCLAGAGFGSVMVVKKARKEYRDEAMENMQALVEETKRAQQKPVNE